MDRPREEWFNDDKDLKFSIGIEVAANDINNINILYNGSEATQLDSHESFKLYEWLRKYHTWRIENAP